MLEKPNTVGKEGDIESNDEAAVSDDPLWAEGASDNGVTKEGSVIEDESELGLITKATLEPPFVEDEFGENNQHKHNEDAGKETRGEETKSRFVILVGKSDKKGGGHKHGEEEIGELLVGFGADHLPFAETKTENHNEGDSAKAGVEL